MKSDKSFSSKVAAVCLVRSLHASSTSQNKSESVTLSIKSRPLSDEKG